MRIAALIGSVVLGGLMGGSAMASTPFWATLIGTPATPAGTGSVSTDTYYTGPLLFSSTTMGEFTVYCVDLNHNVTPGGSYEFIYGPLTENGAGQSIDPDISYEIGQIADIGKNGTGALAVAAQAAIWQLAYPGISQTFSGPDAGAIEADFNSLLSRTYVGDDPARALIPYGYNPIWPLGSGFSPPQEMVVGVPEASTWAMMALGFAGLGFAARRKARSGREAFSAA